MQRSKPISPACTFSARSSAPTTSAPASSASCCLRPAREHADPQRLAGAVGQAQQAAHHLVGVARIDAEVQRQLDGLVELGRGIALHQRDRLGQAVGLVARRPSPRPRPAACSWPWSALHHGEAHRRADPASMRTAPSMSLAFMSFILVSAISRSCVVVTRPTAAPLPGVVVPFGCRPPSSGSSVLGGVLVMKVKVRSPNAVITTGVGVPGSMPCVAALNSLHELHDVEAALAQRRAHRRRRVGLAGRDLQLDVADDLLGQILGSLSCQDRGTSDRPLGRSPAFQREGRL